MTASQPAIFRQQVRAMHNLRRAVKMFYCIAKYQHSVNALLLLLRVTAYIHSVGHYTGVGYRRFGLMDRVRYSHHNICLTLIKYECNKLSAGGRHYMPPPLSSLCGRRSASRRRADRRACRRQRSSRFSRSSLQLADALTRGE